MPLFWVACPLWWCVCYVCPHFFIYIINIHLFIIFSEELCHEDFRQTGPTAWIKTFGECFWFASSRTCSFAEGKQLVSWSRPAFGLTGFMPQEIPPLLPYMRLTDGALEVELTWAVEWSDRKCITIDKQSKLLFSCSKVVSENTLWTLLQCF